jgi:hypothetical protein
VLIIDFAVDVPLLCGSYPVITKGHLPFRPRAASANLQADGASNLYFLEICRWIRVPEKNWSHAMLVADHHQYHMTPVFGGGT